MQIKNANRCLPKQPCEEKALTRLLAPDFFKALADPNRLAILLELAACGRPCSVSELGGCCARDISVVSRHLGKLREAGILKAERRGKEIHYSLAGRLADTLRAIADALDACCPPGSAACCEPGRESRGARGAHGATAAADRKRKRSRS